MTVDDYLKTKRNVPRKIIIHFLEKGFIGDPLNEVDLHNLEFLQTIWGNREMVRAQFAKFSRKEREIFVRTVVYSAKWERYVYNRFYNLPQGEILSVNRVLGEIEDIFHFKPEAEVKQRVLQLRTAARVALHREKKTRNQ